MDGLAWRNAVETALSTADKDAFLRIGDRWFATVLMTPSKVSTLRVKREQQMNGAERQTEKETSVKVEPKIEKSTDVKAEDVENEQTVIEAANDGSAESDELIIIHDESVYI